MAAYFEETDLPGSANWIMQAQEEYTHGRNEIFMTTLFKRGARVILEAIEAPKTYKWDSPVDVFQNVFRKTWTKSNFIN